MDETDEPLPQDSQMSAYFATTEMHYGRLQWLAEHIRLCDFKISPLVAQKILAMLEGQDPACQFELKAVRRSDLPPNSKDSLLQEGRDFDLALEVARAGGFERGYLERVCHEVGQGHGLKGDYVKRRVRRYKDRALMHFAEEESLEAYRRGERDFLGLPKSP